MKPEHDPLWTEQWENHSNPLALLTVVNVASLVHAFAWADREVFDGQIYTFRSPKNNIYQACFYKKTSCLHIRFSRLRWNKDYESSVSLGLMQALGPDFTWIEVFPKESDSIDEENTYHMFGIFPDSTLSREIIDAWIAPRVQIGTYRWSDWYSATRWWAIKEWTKIHPNPLWTEIIEITPTEKDSEVIRYEKVMRIKNALWWRSITAFHIIWNAPAGVIRIIKWHHITSQNEFPNLKERTIS